MQSEALQKKGSHNTSSQVAKKAGSNNLGSDIPLMSASSEAALEQGSAYFLIQSTAAVGTIGAGFAVWPFLTGRLVRKQKL